jgi:hypothetical protein
MTPFLRTFIYYNMCDAIERPFTLELTKQHTSGAEEQPSTLAHCRVTPDHVANTTVCSWDFASFACHSSCYTGCSQSARLRDDDFNIVRGLF